MHLLMPVYHVCAFLHRCPAYDEPVRKEVSIMTAITIVGVDNYLGLDAFTVNQTLVLVREPQNRYDQEAIQVVSDQNIPYGYVANSVSTVAQGTHSAGYIHEMYPDRTKCRVLFKVRGCVIAEIISPENQPDR